MTTESNLDLQTILNTATAAARKAGEYLIANQGKAKVTAQKSVRDWLLEQDKEAEKIILGTIEENFPDHSILSEEKGELSKDSEYQWMVDPLDGSFNYKRGWSEFGITIGFFKKDEVLVGVIYLPARDQLLTSIKGQETFLQDKKVQVSSTQQLNESLVLMGDFSKEGDKEVSMKQIQDIERLSQKVGRVRMIGSAAMDYFYVATGKADALISRSRDVWDFEVGRLFVEQAGGKVFSFAGVSVISNDILHSQIRETLLSDPE